MRLPWGVLALMAAVVLLIGCGEERETTADERLECPRRSAVETPGELPRKSREISISLNRYRGPENVGILMAERRGYFDDLGLAVTVTTGITPEAPARYVQERGVDFGLAQQPQVVMAKEKGAPIVAVGALVPRPTTAMIWLEKSRIEGVADLEGKTIAFPGLPSQRAFLENLLGNAGLTLEDVETRRVGRDLVPPLVDGRADAIFGGSWNLEGAELEARGLKPVITKVVSLGIPAYEESVVVARADRVAEDPRLIRDFMSAVARGSTAAIEDPEQAVRLIERNVETNPSTGRKATEAGIEATLPLLTETGCMDPQQAVELVNWMQEQGMIRRAPTASELLTNLYVKGRP
jgi:putative hydroxymethylpyrimidine transport system substrate-binding protein